MDALRDPLSHPVRSALPLLLLMDFSEPGLRISLETIIPCHSQHLFLITCVSLWVDLSLSLSHKKVLPFPWKRRGVLANSRAGLYCSVFSHVQQDCVAAAAAAGKQVSTRTKQLWVSPTPENIYSVFAVSVKASYVFHTVPQPQGEPALSLSKLAPLNNPSRTGFESLSKETTTNSMTCASIRICWCSLRGQKGALGNFFWRNQALCGLLPQGTEINSLRCIIFKAFCEPISKALCFHQHRFLVAHGAELVADCRGSHPNNEVPAFPRGNRKCSMDLPSSV